MTDNAIISTSQNITVAINNLVKATQALSGVATSETYVGSATKQQVTLGSGRLNNVTVTVAAAVSVSIYNAKSTSVTNAGNLLAVVDATNLGTTILNKNYTDGLVLDIPAGANANLTYSPV